jgi:hypothetical protein
MTELARAIEINLRAEAAQLDGIEILKHDGQAQITVSLPNGPQTLSGHSAREILTEATALWGLGGIISRRTALLYCVATHLSRERGSEKASGTTAA